MKQESKSPSVHHHSHHRLSLSHGCRLTSSIVNRLLTSTSKQPRNKLSTSLESLTLGLLNLPFLAASASAKGHSPVMRMERRTPSDQISDEGL